MIDKIVLSFAVLLYLVAMFFIAGCGEVSRPLVSLDELGNLVEAKAEAEVI